MLQNIRIVLIETSHPGNIGATARAMRTMGLNTLYLVNPLHFPDADATARASGATDVLSNACVVNQLEEALADCTLVIGTSARIRHLSWPLLTPKQASTKLWEAAAQGAPVALVFGREHSGLSNEELQRCHYHVQIPTDPQFSSLNIAAAVQVLCYEIRLAYMLSELTDTFISNAQENTVQNTHEQAECLSRKVEIQSHDNAVTHEDLERFYTHLQQALEQIEFLDPNNPRQLMSRLRRLYTRTQLDQVELNILRGILTAVQKKL